MSPRSHEFATTEHENLSKSNKYLSLNEIEMGFPFQNIHKNLGPR